MKSNYLRVLILTALLAVTLLISACGGVRQAKFEGFTVAAASDAQPPLEKINRAFSEQRSSNIIYGSSGLLAKQIEQGAPIDLYITASKSYIDQLAEKGLIIGRPKPVARAVLVFVTRKAVPAPVGSRKTWSPPGSELSASRLRYELQTITGKIVIANPEHAPYGKAAVQALNKVGLLAQIRPRLVYAESVAQAFQQFNSGAVDSAIVSQSQAIANRTKFYRIDQGLYKPIKLWVALVGKGEANPLTADFARFLRGNKAAEILRKYGYEIAR